MRIYMDEGKNTLKQVVCNQCGRGYEGGGTGASLKAADGNQGGTG